MDFLTTISGATGSLFLTLISFLVVLTVVVFIHEFGHFWVGRLCGVGVTAFSVGFGRELIGWTDRKGTRWKISAIPLGGYVKFVGDLNAASVPDHDQLDRMPLDQRAISFPHQNVAKRAAIVAAGPIANFILAIAIFAGFNYFNGRQVLEPRIEAVQPGSAAEKAGFQSKDLILTVDGRQIQTFADMQLIVSSSAGEPLNFTVERNGQAVALTATPNFVERTSPFGKQRIGLLGVEASRDPSAIKRLTYTPWGAVKAAVVETWNLVDRTLNFIRRLVMGWESADQLSGPIGIARASGTAFDVGGVYSLVSLIGFMSVSIGLINLFPIPLLDGGHLLFYAIEAVRGHPLSEKAQEIGFRIGFALVAMLMLFATWNDLVHLGTSFLDQGS
ncbi:RIP metalloprotease RseP [Microvirga tunisiensis]|uniref:Zinc metalloprotease n=1 Tax=Microvirga tunisiensis TaxID=2108360 RepID=A0A5N7MDM7_9HYPH|nr:RIP metalloprotease RseP [Microvirga tunisiensis]MPR06014.1 RIP metalloprotease RseP [Microvirga tunisiensis]MPR24349.1 RIP metalloprotease RseP [Microvirga tunisiensis]